MSTQYEYRDPQDLTIHPALKSQPRLADDHPTMLAMRKSMKRGGDGNGRRILITAENEIVDGRHWWWNAKKLGWKKIGVEIVPANEVQALIFDTLMNRRHYTAGQRAYIAAQMLPEMFAEAKRRQMACLAQNQGTVPHSVRNGGENQPSALSAEGVQTPESVAASMGISSRVLQQAQEIHELFADKSKRTMTDRDDVTEKGVTFKEFFEPRILLEEDPEAPRTRAYGLGAVLAGIKAALAMSSKEVPHTGGRPKNIQKQLDLFQEGLNGLSSKFTYWQKWEPETRQVAMTTVAPVVEKMPDDLLAEFSKVITTELKRRKK